MGKILALLPPGGPPEGYIEELAGRASSSGSSITALYVVDSVWARFSSADWLSTGPSRAEFDEYMRGVLLAEGRAMAEELSALALERDVPFEYEVLEGDLAGALSLAAAGLGVDEVVVPYGCSAAGLVAGLDCGVVFCGRP